MITSPKLSQTAKFIGPTWGPPGSCRPQMGPMLAPWTLLSGMWCNLWAFQRNLTVSGLHLFCTNTFMSPLVIIPSNFVWYLLLQTRQLWSGLDRWVETGSKWLPAEWREENSRESWEGGNETDSHWHRNIYTKIMMYRAAESKHLFNFKSSAFENMK